eukprot:1084220-Pleurochrysis_carterae.AAC.1
MYETVGHTHAACDSSAAVRAAAHFTAALSGLRALSRPTGFIAAASASSASSIPTYPDSYSASSCPPRPAKCARCAATAVSSARVCAAAPHATADTAACAPTCFAAL